MLLNKDFRKSLPGLLKTFFDIKILVPIFLMMAYTAGIVALLYQINLWDISLLKDTILWFCFTGIVTAFNFVTSKENQNLFKKVIVDNLKVVVIVTFLVNTYTFSLIGELILAASTRPLDCPSCVFNDGVLPTTLIEIGADNAGKVSV